MNALDADGYSPFHNAVKLDNTKIIRYFIENGADLKGKSINGDSLLEVALNAKKQHARKTLMYNQ